MRHLTVWIVMGCVWACGGPHAGDEKPAETCGRTCQGPAAHCGDPPLRQGPAGDARDDAAGRGQIFESIAVPGFTDVQEDTKGTALVDVDRDGLLDIVSVYSGNVRVMRNEKCFRFTEAYEAELRRNANIPNLVDLNGDGWLDLFITHNRGSESNPQPGNTLFVTRGSAFAWNDLGAELGVRNGEAYNRQSSIGDIDNDGWLDIAVGADNIGDMVRLGKPRQRLYRFGPNGTDLEHGRFEDIGGTDIVPGFGGEVVCDADVDRASPGIMLRDLDNDGDLDLLQSYHVDMSQARWDSPCASGEYWQGVYVWRNLLAETGAARFERVTDNGLATAGRMRYDTAKRYYVPDTEHPDALGLPYVSLADVNNDGLLDVLAVGPTDPGWHVQSGMVSGRFWYNRGNFQFEEATSAAGLDALNWTYREWDALFDTGTTAEIDTYLPYYCAPWSPQRPLCRQVRTMDHQFYAADTVFGDFDNDGWLDFVLVDRRELPVGQGGIRNVLFLNDGHGRFRPLPTTVSGLDRGSMAAVADDLDGDGLLDLVLVVSPGNSTSGLWNTPPEYSEDSVYWNTGANGARDNHWMRMRFSGSSDAQLVGARVEVYEAGTLGKAGQRLLGMRVVSSNQNYKSGNALAAHFGLGGHTRVDVLVTLLGGRTLRFRDLAADRFFDLDLDAATAALVFR